MGALERLSATMNPLRRFINFEPRRVGATEELPKKSLVGTNANRKSNKMMWQNICDYLFAIVFGFAKRIFALRGRDRKRFALDTVFIALINNQDGSTLFCGAPFIVGLPPNERAADEEALWLVSFSSVIAFRFQLLQLLYSDQLMEWKELFDR